MQILQQKSKDFSRDLPVAFSATRPEPDATAQPWQELLGSVTEHETIRIPPLPMGKKYYEKTLNFIILCVIVIEISF
jgi:hypothetical protein